MKLWGLVTALSAILQGHQFGLPNLEDHTSSARNASAKFSQEGVNQIRQLGGGSKGQPNYLRHMQQPFQRPKSQRKKQRQK